MTKNKNVFAAHTRFSLFLKILAAVIHGCNEFNRWCKYREFLTLHTQQNKNIEE